MWGKDDDIRVLMKSLREALTKSDASRDEWRVVAAEIALPMLDQIDEMVKKEEKILFPMALKTLTPEEWGAVYRDSARFGSCLAEPGTGYRPPTEKKRGEETPAETSIRAGVGSLTAGQLKALLRVLPVDLTFVDADDRVAFFSEGKERIFGRSQSIIGRKVQNCHPPQSVEVVERIISDFRSGRRDVAEFWIDFKGRFVHIRYFAVRSESGEYLGTLEVTQDLSRPRSLTGERRLLQYEGEA
jgi:PAS domain S-box-containing protein